MRMRCISKFEALSEHGSVWEFVFENYGFKLPFVNKMNIVTAYQDSYEIGKVYNMEVPQA